MDPRLHTYLQHLLETAHQVGSNTGKTMPAPLAEKMLADLQIQLEQRLTTALVDQLSPADLQSYAELVARTPAAEEVSAFFNSHIQGADSIVANTLQQFEQDYIQVVNRTPHANQQ